MVYATPDQLEALTMGERIAVLREGRIVQTGTPDELYLRPADQFVATMVGAPPMNLVPGKVRGGADGPVIALPFADLDGSRWRDLQGGADVLFGIRPHDLMPAADPGTHPGFRARVHLTEPLGDMTVIDVEAEGTVLKMALPEEQALAYGVGDELALRLSLADAHLFHRDSGGAVDAFDK
jgi:multiple sugar transport system ATP-binding protein